MDQARAACRKILTVAMLLTLAGPVGAVMLGVGLIMGAYLGYANEEEIDEMAHLMHKNQKKMSRKAHRAYRTICSCMDH